MEARAHPIFAGILPAEYEEMEAGGGLRIADFPKGTVIFRAGERTEEFGILLNGTVHIENIDWWGNRMILHGIAAGEAFGETYALCGVPLMVDVTAVQDSRVLLVNLQILLHAGRKPTSWQSKLTHNLLLLCSRKNLAWSSRVLCISAKGIRARVMAYLSAEAMRCKSRELVVPFDRQQMADYLNVERSALSKELGRMQREGILTFRKNRFYLHRMQEEL